MNWWENGKLTVTDRTCTYKYTCAYVELTNIMDKYNWSNIENGEKW